jgi:CRISPR-associated protein Csx17
MALGQLERAMATSLRWTLEETYHMRPMQGLRPEWLTRSNTGTTEFRLASALAGVRARMGKETLWLRQHLEPLDMGANAERAWVNWAKLPSNDVVWHEGDLTNALNAILARRIIRVEKSGARGWPDWSPHTASLDDITQFIEGRTDDALLADLLWGLSLIDWEKIVREERASRLETENQRETWTPPGDGPQHAVPSSLYALLRLCFQRASGSDPAIPLVPSIHLRAAQRQGEAASELAARRLRGSGYAPLVACIPVNGEPARRTAAALIFPINPRDFRVLENTILHQPETTNP